MKLRHPLLITTLILAACSEKSNDAPISHPSQNVLELPVTSEIGLPEKGVAYAFVPNDVAQWLSQIVILSEDGDLYQATADTRMAKAIEGLKMKSVLGLNRPKAPGMFLAISETGDLNAYVEVDDDGTLSRTEQVFEDYKIDQFCSHSTTPTDNFHALLDNGKTQSFSLTVSDNKLSLVAGKEIAISKNPAGCTVNADGGVSLPSADVFAYLRTKDNAFILQTKPNHKGLIVSPPGEENRKIKVGITNGITIPGIKNPQSVYVASENFGGPFNNGLVLVSDADEPRFVVISADFARKTLSETP